jgi:hypothetical protein
MLLCVCVGIGFGAFRASAAEPPTSAEELRTRIETSVKAKDTNALNALFNSNGVSDRMKTIVGQTFAHMVTQGIVDVKLAPLVVHTPLTNEVNGVRYRPNVDVVGMIDVNLAKKGKTASVSAVSLPYGKAGKNFYIAGTIVEKIPGATLTSKALSVMVMGDASPDAAKIVGSITYVNGGKEITDDLDGRGNLSKSFWGDYVKSVTVHKTVANNIPINVIIMEDGKRIFESKPVIDESPIVYTRK